MSAGFEIQKGVLVNYAGNDIEVVIPNGVTEIAKDAFFENKKIASVIMPDSVVKIGSQAFRNCTKLKEVIFSKNIVEIEYNAFSGCKSLKEIILPENLQRMASGVFAGCEKLAKVICEAPDFIPTSNPFYAYGEKEVPGVYDSEGYLVFAKTLLDYKGYAKEIIVPDGVERILNAVFKSGVFAWEEKFDIERLVLPKSVKYIGENAFANCTKLTSVEMPEGIEFGVGAFQGCSGLAGKDGMFIHDSIVLAYFGDGDTVVIPEGIKVIASKVFANASFGDYNPGNKNIHQVVFPETLEIIESEAFAECDLLESIVIPKSVKKIGTGAFKGCDHLSHVTLPEQIEELGEAIFSGCRRLADENGFIIKNNVLYSYYGGEKNVVIPEGVNEIANYVFDNSAITSIKFPSTLKSLGASFGKCEFLVEIEIPEGITDILPNSFAGCKNLKKVILPTTLKNIGRGAFNGCESLVDIEIPAGVMLIENYAFAKCKSLEKIEIPEGVNEVAPYCFYTCEKLKSVKLPHNIKKIGNHSFFGCVELEAIDIWRNVSMIEESAFSECWKLSAVNVEENHVERIYGLSAFEHCNSLCDEQGMLIVDGIFLEYKGDGGNVIIPEGVTRIEKNVFREGTAGNFRHYKEFRKKGSLKSVVFPSTLKVINKNAFASCEALKSVKLPDGLQIIDEAVFQGCNQLKKIEIGEGLNKIGTDAFFGCTKLKEFVVHEENKTFSTQDGMLVNKAGDTLIWFTAGKNLKSYTIPENISKIEVHAFIDCKTLKKIVIPATALTLEDEIFPRTSWEDKFVFDEIEIDPKAGTGGIGRDVFDFGELDIALVYPKLPVTFVKEQKNQVRLGLGYCMNPDMYSGEYEKIYEKYAKSHEKTLIKKATQLKLEKVKAYFCKTKNGENENSGYTPNLSLKKPSELAKVELLEETVQKGSLRDLAAVLETYKTFEMMARALGIAARYRGVEFVKMLVEYGATFNYKNDSNHQRKYKMNQQTAAGSYHTEYYLMIIPEKLQKYYDYTPMYGVAAMNLSQDLEVLSLEKRIEVVKFFYENKCLGVSMDEMLFFALTRGELGFADALIEMGVNLQKTAPSYYESWGSYPPVYIKIITEIVQSVYWNEYVLRLSGLEKKSVLPVLERFQNLAEKAGAKIAFSQKLFDEIKWSDESLAFALKVADLTKVNQKKALETAVKNKAFFSLELMAAAGWLNNSKKREGLIAFARDNKYNDSLAWLMDFKNRTVDVAKEEAKEEAKMFRELMEDPNSVSALKKKWSYKKLEDGTLQITSYKGDEENVEIPSKIGKAAVTSIAEEAFSIAKQGIKNEDSRKKIKSIVIPEGVVEFGNAVFLGCEMVEKIVIPSTLKCIGDSVFCGCENLSDLNLPPDIKNGLNLFAKCKKLRDENGFVIINHVFYCYGTSQNQDKVVVIPDDVTKIADFAFKSKWSSDIPRHIEKIILPEGLKEIGEGAFVNLSNLKEINIPASVKVIGKNAFYNAGLEGIELVEGLEEIREAAFYGTKLMELRIPKTVTTIESKALLCCRKLKDLYIPATVTKWGKSVLGSTEEEEEYIWDIYEPNGVYVHTPVGSAAEGYMKKYSGVAIVNDYPEE